MLDVQIQLFCHTFSTQFPFFCAHANSTKQLCFHGWKRDRILFFFLNQLQWQKKWCRSNKSSGGEGKTNTEKKKNPCEKHHPSGKITQQAGQLERNNKGVKDADKSLTELNLPLSKPFFASEKIMQSPSCVFWGIAVIWGQKRPTLRIETGSCCQKTWVSCNPVLHS